MSSDAWRLRAACRGMDTLLFFPERGEATEHIKAVCRGCPVRSECLNFALTSRRHPLDVREYVGIGEMHGIWGGTSERERRVLRRERRAG